MPSRHDSSDSDDEGEWAEPHEKSRKRKLSSIHSRSARNMTGLEEGEISSDDLDDDEDDGLDENLLGGEEDKRKLAKMSEKEREEELFKRAERRDAIQARKAVKQKLKEKRNREKAERASKPSAHKHKKSAYANVFSSDDEPVHTDSSDAAGPQGLWKRKKALEKRKEAHSHKFHQLIQQRRQQAAKKQRMLSEDSEADEESNRRPSGGVSSLSDSDEDVKRHKNRTSTGSRRGPSMSERIFSDASDSSASSRPGARTTTRRPSLSSLSGESSSDNNARGRSRSPDVVLVSSIEQLSRIRLSRFKLEKWVHMPFFDDLVKGCFVRLNIGLFQGVPVYRVAEVVEAVETPKIYDLGDTRTNKGIVVRVGKDQSTFRLAFVSNSEFTQSEFESWLRRITDANMKPPSLAFIERKAADIKDAINRPIRDERVVEQIIQSKRRFQRAPTNFALRKAELIKLREQAEVEGDTEAIQRYDMEIEDIESQAERIDRRRTLGFKSITSINQRNRVLSLQQAEEAIRKESEEALNSKEEDPFMRVHSQPVIVTKKYLEQLREKRSGAAKDLQDSQAVDSASNDTLHTPNASNLLKTRDSPDTGGSVKWSLAGEPLSVFSTPQDSLHAIHNFEININLDLDGTSDRQGTTTPARSNNLNSSTVTSDSLSTTPGVTPIVKPNRRSLNLQEYKKRMGLI